jgi:hypothetical protein
MHKVSNQPDQPAVACQPCVAHVCPRNACRTCNCADTCADDDTGDADGFPIGSGPAINAERISPKRCAVSGQPCPGIECREWCEGGGNGSTLDNDWGTATPTNNN